MLKKFVTIRLSQEDERMLLELVEVLGECKSAVIKRSIQYLYNEKVNKNETI